jgi:hypothetical protein
MDKGGVLYMAFKIDRLKCLEIPEGSLKSQGSTRGLSKLGYVALSKSREVLTRVSVRPRSKGSILIKEVNLL